MNIIYLTRYSFLGQSDWRSKAASDAELLFDDTRLNRRAELLEKVALRSLADQTDPDFEMLLLSAEAMPEIHKSRVRQLCGDLLGDRAHVVFAAPGHTADRITEYRLAHMRKDGTHSVQTIMDDDDGLSSDFTDRIRRESDAALSLMRDNQVYTYISHARGVTLAYLPDGSHALYHRLVPTTTIGLTLLAPHQDKRSPFRIAHKKIVNRRPVRLIYGRQIMYVRGVHEHNDSRAMIGKSEVAPEEIIRLRERELPLLQAYFDKNGQSVNADYAGPNSVST